MADDRRDTDSGDNKKWNLKAPRSLISRGSRMARVTEIDPESGEWRTVIKMTRKKIHDDEKGVFLQEYAKWGRMAEAAAAIDCTPDTVKAEMKRDPEFAEACLLAEYAYRDKLISHHQDLLFNGTQKDSYDRNGNLVSTETIYPIRLIELELKKHDAGYRDKQEVDVRVSGGVLVAPAAVASVDDWEARFSIAKDVTPVDRATDEETD
jgi:hypothetical protein